VNRVPEKHAPWTRKSGIAAALSAGYPNPGIRTHTSLSRATAATALTISLDRAPYPRGNRSSNINKQKG
jgi:hypothetical protein